MSLNVVHYILNLEDLFDGQKCKPAKSLELRFKIVNFISNSARHGKYIDLHIYLLLFSNDCIFT